MISPLTSSRLKRQCWETSTQNEQLPLVAISGLWWRLRGLDFGIVPNCHQDGGGPLLCDLLKQLNISESDVALDLGSGKGGAMAALARFPFREVHGVEISPEFVAAARKNFAKLKIRRCRVYLADASTFTELDDYTHIFMYNPFAAVVLTQVLANLEASLRRKPRTVRLLYSNPLHEQVILATCTFKKAFVYEPYPNYRISAYENRAPLLTSSHRESVNTQSPARRLVQGGA
jgi:predicted RNA methylase